MVFLRPSTSLGMLMLLATAGYGQQPMPESDVRPEWVIAIHGGAGSAPARLTRQQNEARYDGMRAALRLGVESLRAKRSAMETVEAVIRQLEDDPNFNAGKGAVFTREGRHELDASIMDGSTLECGAVAGVTIARNPIRLARLVMTRTKHVLLSGEGADRFAQTVGVETVGNDFFDTDRQRVRWESSRRDHEAGGVPVDHKGTVGCVVLDARGNLAAGTSTGGLSGKRFGRIGDSPLIGAGTYADNRSVGVSCTGIGEHFIRHAVAYDLAARLRYAEQPLEEAANEIMRKTLQPDWGGLIAVDRSGTAVAVHNTPAMASGIADSTGRFSVNWKRDAASN